MQKLYKTKFNLSIKLPGNEVIKESKICEELHRMCHFIFWENFLYISNANKLCFDRPISWPEYDFIMKKISLKFPTVLFILEGDGEDKHDIWKNYYQNGQVQQCKGHIVYDEFKPELFTSE